METVGARRFCPLVGFTTGGRVGRGVVAIRNHLTLTRVDDCKDPLMYDAQGTRVWVLRVASTVR